MSKRNDVLNLVREKEAASLDMMVSSEKGELAARWMAAVASGLTVFSITAPHSHGVVAGIAGVATGATMFFALSARHQSTQAGVHRGNAAAYDVLEKEIVDNQSNDPAGPGGS